MGDDPIPALTYRGDHPFDSEEGCQVGGVRGYYDEGEKPPDPAYDAGAGGLWRWTSGVVGSGGVSYVRQGGKFKIVTTIQLYLHTTW